MADDVWQDVVKFLGGERKGTPVLGYEAAPALAVRTDLDVDTLC
ncbi:hypothetical protein ACWCQ1_10465 [Streptomyces sp. NPDC002144]